MRGRRMRWEGTTGTKQSRMRRGVNGKVGCLGGGHPEEGAVGGADDPSRAPRTRKSSLDQPHASICPGVPRCQSLGIKIRTDTARNLMAARRNRSCCCDASATCGAGLLTLVVRHANCTVRFIPEPSSRSPELRNIKLSDLPVTVTP
jgi:hypothetical protein